MSEEWTVKLQVITLNNLIETFLLRRNSIFIIIGRYIDDRFKLTYRHVVSQISDAKSFVIYRQLGKRFP